MSRPDSEILSRIGALVERERELRARHAEAPLDETDRRRLDGLEAELDQCWDLLNQRRALREHGMDPDGAAVRDEDTVEDYLQ